MKRELTRAPALFAASLSDLAGDPVRKEVAEAVGGVD